MNKQRSTGNWVAAVVLILLLLGLPTGYLAAYYAMLDPQDSRVESFEDEYFIVSYSPRYRSETPWVNLFFAPAHQLDRLFRSEHWETEYLETGSLRWQEAAGETDWLA